MAIPTPPDLARGKVSWTVGRTDGTTLPGARGTVRFEATAVAVAYSTATVLPAPVETPVVAGVMTPVDLLVNDPEVWNWRVTPRLGVVWEPFHIDVDGPVDLATAAVVPGKGPIRAVKGVKGDTGASTISDVTGLAARLAALEYRSGVRSLSRLLSSDFTVAWLYAVRHGATVSIHVTNIAYSGSATGTVTVAVIPSGLRPYATATTVTTRGKGALITASGSLQISGTPSASVDSFTFTYLTPDPIPSPPPGDPA